MNSFELNKRVSNYQYSSIEMFIEARFTVLFVKQIEMLIQSNELR